MYFQNDVRWRDDKMGPNGPTIGEEGCLIVCVCNANLFLRNPLHPDKLVRELISVDGFTENGDIIWAKLFLTSSKVWKHMDTERSGPVLSSKILEYESPRGSHFILWHRNRTYDPKPGTRYGDEKSLRRLALIER